MGRGRTHAGSCPARSGLVVAGLAAAGPGVAGLLGGCAATPGGGGPFVVVVEAGAAPQELTPWTYCRTDGSSGACADGFPPDDPVDLGRSDSVRATFARDGWSFRADFLAAGSDRSQVTGTVVLGDLSTGAELVAPVCGPADVDLSGRDGGGNDLVTTFRWTPAVAADGTVC